MGCRRGPGQSRLKARALKMSRVPSLSSPFLIGFDQIERALDRVAKAADGYPPYNIERLAADGNDPNACASRWRSRASRSINSR